MYLLSSPGKEAPGAEGTAPSLNELPRAAASCCKEVSLKSLQNHSVTKCKGSHLLCSDCPLELFEKVVHIYCRSSALCCQLTCGGKTTKPDGGTYTTHTQLFPYATEGHEGTCSSTLMCWWATSKPPDLGACAASAGTVRRNYSPDLPAQPDW